MVICDGRPRNQHVDNTLDLRVHFWKKNYTVRLWYRTVGSVWCRPEICFPFACVDVTTLLASWCMSVRGQGCCSFSMSFSKVGTSLFMYWDLANVISEYVSQMTQWPSFFPYIIPYTTPFNPKTIIRWGTRKSSQYHSDFLVSSNWH